MKMSENWKKANVIEKISMIMVILNALFISITGLLNFFFNINLFFYYQDIQSFAVVGLLIFLGIYSWRNNRVFAYLLWFAIKCLLTRNYFIIFFNVKASLHSSLTAETKEL